MTTIPLIDVADPVGPGEPWIVRISSPGGSTHERFMKASRDASGSVWPMPHPSTRPTAGDATSWDRKPDYFVDLAAAIAHRNPSGEQAARAERTEHAQQYGRHLFDALIGIEGWKVLTADVAEGPLVVGLRLGKVALHHLVWELMHNGTDYLALDEAAPVVLLRLGPRGGTPPDTIERLPRVVFAVGARLADASVRSGAEVMGILRGIERDGGSVSARLLASTSLPELKQECKRFEPDIVHIISHGWWDAEEGVGKVTLQAESGRGTEDFSGAELARAIGRPALVVLSACESGITSSHAGAPVAAELVASGVPIAIAMAGAISDTACRVFTRAVAAAVALGVPLVRALAQGRQAAFAYAKSKPQQIDWALPAVFASTELGPDFCLADRGPIDAMKKWILRHQHNDQPLFSGRQGLFRDLDAVLTPESNPGVLMLHSSYGNKVGGTRALVELAAEAMRLGHLPVRIGPYKAGDAPTTFEALIDAIVRQMRVIAAREEVDPPGRCAAMLAAPAVAGAPGDRELSLVDELRKDLIELRDNAVAQLDGLLLPDRAPVLLLDDVHHYDRGLEQFFHHLGSQGLGEARTKLPVILFGKVTPETSSSYGRLLEENRGPGRLRPLELHHVAALPDKDHAVAFISWMLHPTTVEGWPHEVLAPRRMEDEQWIDFFKGVLVDRPFYDPRAHAMTVEFGLTHGHLVEGDDVAILKASKML